MADPMKRFHAAGICDCCDGPPEEEERPLSEYLDMEVYDVVSGQKYRELQRDHEELSRCVMHGWTEPAFVRGRLHERAVEIARAALSSSSGEAGAGTPSATPSTAEESPPQRVSSPEAAKPIGRRTTDDR